MKMVTIAVLVGLSLSCAKLERQVTHITQTDGHVVCYSGGVQIFEGTADGKVYAEERSSGYYLKDKSDGKLKEVSGDCIITY